MKLTLGMDNKIKCPHCEGTFDFDSLSKNDWSIELEYILIRCQMCGKIFKIKMRIPKDE